MSYNQISERSARSVRKLYKALLRVGRKWPVSENRRDRSLYEAIPRVTKQRYSILRTGLRPEQVKEYGEKGVAELNSLHNLINNVHLQEVRTFHTCLIFILCIVTRYWFKTSVELGNLRKHVLNFSSVLVYYLFFFIPSFEANSLTRCTIVTVASEVPSQRRLHSEIQDFDGERSSERSTDVGFSIPG